MALFKDGKVYRTLEQQVAHLTKAHNEQIEINEEVQEEISELPTKKYVNDQDEILQGEINGKTDKGEEIIVLEITSTSGTLSEEDFDLLEKENVVVKYNNYYMTKIFDGAAYYKFAGIHYKLKYYLFEVTKSTKTYTITDTPFNVEEDGVLNDNSGDVVGKVLTVDSNYKSKWKNVEVHDSNVVSDNMAAGYVLTTNGSNGATWSSVPASEGTTIKSTGVTSGKVLTANGLNGASWETPSGGTFTHYVEITSSSGTLTDNDYEKLTYNDSVVLYGTTKILLYKITDSNSSLIFLRTATASTPSTWNRLIVTKSTKEYSYSTGNVKIGNDNIDSQTATNGQVLTADGSGGASWQTQSGGTPEGTSIKSTGVSSGWILKANGSGGCAWIDNVKYLYEHNISLYSSSPDGSIRFTFFSSSSTAITTTSTLRTVLRNLYSSKYIPANGYCDDTSSNKYIVIGIQALTSSTQFNLDLYNLTTFSSAVLQISNWSMNDNVRTITI